MVVVGEKENSGVGATVSRYPPEQTRRNVVDAASAEHIVTRLLLFRVSQMG